MNIATALYTILLFYSVYQLTLFIIGHKIEVLFIVCPVPPIIRQATSTLLIRGMKTIRCHCNWNDGTTMEHIYRSTHTRMVMVIKADVLSNVILLSWTDPRIDTLYVWWWYFLVNGHLKFPVNVPTPKTKRGLLVRATELTKKSDAGTDTNSAPQLVIMLQTSLHADEIICLMKLISRNVDWFMGYSTILNICGITYKPQGSFNWYKY